MRRLLGLSLAVAIASTLGCGGDEDCNKCSKVGATQCSGTQVQTCTADVKGCRTLSAAAPCAFGSFCSATTNACAPCVNACSTAGISQCVSATQQQTCTADANGCLSATAPAACPASQTCIAGECAVCLRPVTASATTAANVQHFGTLTVGQVLTFAVPAGTDGFSIVSQAVNAQTTDIHFSSGGQIFAIPNSVVPEIVQDPSGATFYNDLPPGASASCRRP